MWSYLSPENTGLRKTIPQRPSCSDIPYQTKHDQSSLLAEGLLLIVISKVKLRASAMLLPLTAGGWSGVQCPNARDGAYRDIHAYGE
jgi:hypothetical protein